MSARAPPTYAGPAVCFLVLLVGAGLLSSFVLLPANLPTSPPPPPSSGLRCSCFNCSDFRIDGECDTGYSSSGCAQECDRRACTIRQHDSSDTPCSTGACCRLDEADIIATQRDCRFLHDGTYAGDGVESCSQRGSCCLARVATNSYCLNGIDATQCFFVVPGLYQSLSALSVFSASACAVAALEPCVPGVAPRPSPQACCQLPNLSCSQDLDETTCTGAPFNGVYGSPTSVCSAAGTCV